MITNEINLFYPFWGFIFLLSLLGGIYLIDKIKFLKPLFFKHTETLTHFFDKSTDDLKEMSKAVNFTVAHERELHDLEVRLKALEALLPNISEQN